MGNIIAEGEYFYLVYISPTGIINIFNS